jgi:hypothetical protein
MTTDAVNPESFTYHESDSNPDSELELLQAGGQQAEQEDGQEDGQEDEQDDVVKYAILGN